MVLFDQLRISDDGKLMFINIHVNQAEYFKDVYLKNIKVMTGDKVFEASDACFPTSAYIYCESFGESVKEAHVVIDKGVLDAAYINWNPSTKEVIDSTKPHAQVSFTGNNFSKDLFFVYVETTGEADECVPCGISSKPTVGVTFDETLLYQHVMGFTKSLADSCTVPTGFADFILLWNAFKSSVETEHWVPALKYYNMLFGNPNGNASIDGSHSPYGSWGNNYSGSMVSRPCGCR